MPLTSEEVVKKILDENEMNASTALVMLIDALMEQHVMCRDVAFDHTFGGETMLSGLREVLAQMHDNNMYAGWDQFHDEQEGIELDASETDFRVVAEQRDVLLDVLEECLLLAGADLEETDSPPIAPDRP